MNGNILVINRQLLIFMRLGVDHAKWLPILEELAAEYDGQIYIYKVDTEQE